MRAVSTPKPWLAARASPESFRRTRLKMGSGMPSEYYRRLKKGTFRCPLKSLSLLFRLRDGDGLASVADLKSCESPDGNVLAQLADLRRDELRNRNSLVLDEGLLVQADFLVELFHLASNHLLGDIRGLAAGHGLREIDVLLALEIGLGNVFFTDEFRIAGGNVHGNVVH